MDHRQRENEKSFHAVGLPVIRYAAAKGKRLEADIRFSAMPPD
jgi:hypothetical protein